MYCIDTLKDTGLLIKDLEANTDVKNSRVENGSILFKFHFESPRILTESESVLREITTSVMGLVFVLVILNFRSSTLPAIKDTILLFAFAFAFEGKSTSSLLLLSLSISFGIIPFSLKLNSLT